MTAIQGARILSPVHHKFFTNTDKWHCDLMLKSFLQTNNSESFPTAKDAVLRNRDYMEKKDMTGRGE